MRLFEAIVEANHRAIGGDKRAGIHPDEFAAALPVVALTCIDPRLNPLVPEVLGIPEDKFIWLRNAGNIIFDSMSSMMRTLALACAVKGGKEIAVIGHSDCLVGKVSVMQLTDRFRDLGIERSKLPDNLNEFFGLFASERQNVIRGVGFVRSSPLIGPAVPVHGLFLDIVTGRLEWVVNGYETLAAAHSAGAERPFETAPLQSGHPGSLTSASQSADFKLGDFKFPDTKIGELASHAAEAIADFKISAPGAAKEETLGEAIGEAVHEVKEAVSDLALKFNTAVRYQIIGSDMKRYGPIPGAKILEWIREGRIDWDTPGQVEGSGEWKPLSIIAEESARLHAKLPPVIRFAGKVYDELQKQRKKK